MTTSSEPLEAVYRLEGGLAVTRGHAAGPWDRSMQHGSAPAALVAWAVEAIPTPLPMQVARLTLDLMRPVPVAPLTVSSRIVRGGRKIQLCEIILSAEGVEVVRASALRVVERQALCPGGLGLAPPSTAQPDELPAPSRFAGMGSPFLDGVSMRIAHGAFDKPGPSAVWYRADRPIVDDAATTPLMRAALTADFCNGTGAMLDIHDWVFPNADLTLHLARPPEGDWILLEADNWIGPDGVGVASGRLADTHGEFGRVTQTLVVARR